MRRALEESLKRLGTDHIDFYQLHNPRLDAIVDADDLWTELDKAKQEGLIGAVGTALGPAFDLRQAGEGVASIEKRQAPPQIIYNLFEQGIGEIIIPAAREHGVSVLARVPHASGLLDGSVNNDTTFEPGDHRNWRVTTNARRKEWLEDGLVKLERLKFLTEGRTIGQAALQFILHEPAMAAVLPNIYDEAGLEDFASYDKGRRMTDEEYTLIQDLYARNFDLPQPASTPS
jgi:aryl-alcohol dehydrogenase-like predicted oxidoreductase